MTDTSPTEMTDAELITAWLNSGDNPTERDLAFLAEIERRGLDF